jgi:hypothetical protein
MRLYADLPARRLGQLTADACVAVWVVAWVVIGSGVHHVVLGLAAPGRGLEDAGNGLGDNLTSAAQAAGDVPVVGDGLRGPIDGAAGAAGALARAGQAQQDAVGQLALVLGIVVALAPILLALAVWLPRRVRFARRASAAQHLVDSAADLDLFALRAMATQPMHVLARISDDPAGEWRRGVPDTVHRLAELELRACGLRAPEVPAA